MASEDNPCPHWYRVCLNTIVRKGVKLDSERMRILPMGSRVHVVEVNDRRVQIDQPISGWCSLRSSNGDTILTPLNDDGPSETPKSEYKKKRKDLEVEQDKLNAEQEALNMNIENVKNNPRTADLLSQMNDLKSKLNLHKDLLASQDKLKQDYDQLQEQMNEQESERVEKRKHFDELLKLQEELAKVAVDEGLKNPLELQNHLAKLKEKQENNKQQLETYQTLAAAAESELQEMKVQMAKLMANDPDEGNKQLDDYRDGDVVLIPKFGLAIVRYCGNVDSPDADPNTVYVGVQFDNDAGDTNGVINGRTYFQCKDNHGQFFPIGDVAKQITAGMLLKKLNQAVQEIAQQQTAKD